MSAYALLAHTTANAVNAGTLAAASDNAFGKATVNAKLTDSTTFITLSSSNTWTHAATGNYQLLAQVAFGYASTNAITYFRTGLYNVTGGSFATHEGGSLPIISESGVGSGVNAGTSNGFVQIMARYTVSSASDHYAIYSAGKVGSGTWFSNSYAQGAAAASVTTGTKPEVYKLIQITQE